MIREPTLGREQPVRSEDSSGELQGEPGESLNQQNWQMTLKSVPTSGRSKLTYFIYRHHNEPRVQFYVPKEETFPIQQIYWCNKFYSDWSGRFASETCRWQLGISIQTEACQIRGKVSQSLFYWKKNLPQDTCGPRRDWQTFERLPEPDHVWPKVWT